MQGIAGLLQIAHMGCGQLVLGNPRQQGQRQRPNKPPQAPVRAADGLARSGRAAGRP